MSRLANELGASHTEPLPVSEPVVDDELDDDDEDDPYAKYAERYNSDDEDEDEESGPSVYRRGA